MTKMLGNDVLLGKPFPAMALEKLLWSHDELRLEVVEILSACIPTEFREEFVREIVALIRRLEQEGRSRTEIAAEVLFEAYGDDYETEREAPLRIASEASRESATPTMIETEEPSKSLSHRMFQHWPTTGPAHARQAEDNEPRTVAPITALLAKA